MLGFSLEDLEDSLNEVPLRELKGRERNPESQWKKRVPAQVRQGLEV